MTLVARPLELTAEHVSFSLALANGVIAVLTHHGFAGCWPTRLSLN
jgi:ABC-type phosphate transport system auxiliary subunit